MKRPQDDPSAVGETPERRRAARHVALFPATFQTIFGDRHYCLSRDVSSSGGLFLTIEAYEPGERIGIKLHLGGPDTESKTTARVVRVRPLEISNVLRLYDTAVEFEQPSENVETTAKSLSDRQRRLGLFQGNRSRKDR